MKDLLLKRVQKNPPFFASSECGTWYEGGGEPQLQSASATQGTKEVVGDQVVCRIVGVGRNDLERRGRDCGGARIIRQRF